MELFPTSDRRKFIKTGGLILVTALGTPVITNAEVFNSKEEEEGITPTEDLMREHGILNRVLLVYEECITLIKKGKDFSPEVLQKATSIIREFIEDYHEKQEEDFLFPRFEKAGKLTDLVSTLRKQHKVGRLITDHVKELASRGMKSKEDKDKVSEKLQTFIHFYRPHESREDTVLFPALRSIISKNEFDALGEEFEKNEHKKFGADGFELYLNKVETIEKELGIYDLSKFTPDV